MSNDRQGSVSAPSDSDATRAEKSKCSGELEHELRTPLNHIIGYCEMLMEQAQDDGLNIFIADLNRIHSAGERLLGVVDDLCNPVAHRKIDEVSMHHEVRTPLNQVIGYAEMLQEQAKDLGHHSFASDLQKVHTAGRRLLDLIVENFASMQVNSGDAVGDDLITSKRHQAFAREPTTTQNKVVSAAIGAASLLVADDNELNRDMLRRRLERLGYKVSCAGNGVEVLRLLRTGSFDLLLLDIIMPVMDGFEVLEQLKIESRLRDIPVIVLSASDQLDHVVKCIQKGAQDYLSKPFSPVLLQARIGSCLERKRLRDQETLHLRQIEEEKQRSDELLHVILPRDIAAELKATAAVKPRRFEKVGILFCDIVGFTVYSERHRPEEILSHLQSLVEAFEQLCVQHNLEKIKTIGDSFMATAGLLAPLENPALNCVKCGLEMVTAARSLPACWDVRVGVHVGPVIAGVVGRRKYQYDVWGDTVNTAARMQKAADPGSICVNDETWEVIKEHCCGRGLGRIQVKGKGEQELFLVDGLSN